MRWQPGQSGNPKGKQPNWAWRNEVTRIEPKAWQLWEKAIDRGLASKGAPSPVAIRAAGEIIAYAHGRPAQTQNVRVIQSIEELSSEELDRLIDGPSAPTIEGKAE